MSQARHARPADHRRPSAVTATAGPGQGRHRAQRRAAPVRPAVVGAAVLAVAAGGLGVHRATADDAAQLSAVAFRPAPEAAEAARVAAARASRTEERTRVKAAQKRAREQLKAIRAREAQLERERRARVARERCAQAEAVLAGLDLSAEQQRNLAIIADTARRLGLPPRAAVVAVAAAWQESRLRNLDYGLADSIGMFQQRPSMGWGSNSQLVNPYYSTRKFYERLVEIRGWQRMRVGDAAQAVQASAYPRAYDQWVTSARDAVRALQTLHRNAAHC